jgi:hypothetical protein
MRKHYTLYNIYNATRTLLVIAALLIAGGGGDVWGQTTPERITDWTEIQKILEANVNTNKDVKKFLDLVNAGSIDIESGSIEGTVREEGSRYVYDIKWTQYVSTETKWPDKITAATSNNYSISLTDTTSAGYSKKIIYARQGEEKTLAFQEGGGAENIDGFIWWYEKASQGNDPADKSDRLAWGGYIEDNAKSLTFKNGLAWLRGHHSKRTFTLCLQYPKTGQNQSWSADNTWTKWGNLSTAQEDYSPTSACQIKYTVPTDATEGAVYRVVFAGSASNEIGAVTNNTITPPEISVRTVYEIHVISEARCTETLGDNITIPVNNESEMEAFKKKFVASYEVYKPYESGTNFRLAEPIGNYYVPEGNTIASPQSVVWTAYGSNGQQLNPQPAITYHNNGEIAKLTFPQEEDKTKQATFYLIAEAVNNSGTKYAAAFRTVHLEPYTETLTQAEIEVKAASDPTHYQERSEAYLERADTRYEKIVDISFDGENISEALTIENNYLTSRPGVLSEPSYAFANPGDYANRKNNRRSVGRGEYAFYRTLNYTGISKTAQGYNDYFMSSGATDEIRTTYMVDRTYKKTGTQYGYFMYLDATDEPGVITKIEVKQLCPHTTLIASAWICDMAHSDNASHADVGFTFKWKAEDGTETILAKYYSGVIERSTTDGVAGWKQIFFKFKITDVPTSEGTYILEIANNTPNSNGADYGIDDIQVWRSLPDIRVQREDACNASTLCISSNYETILNNLGWDHNEEVINKDELSDRDRRKYRYGLMNSNSYANIDTLQYALKTGNVYFSFAYPNPIDSANGTWGQDTEDWVTVNKNLLDGGESDNAIKNGNYHKTIRVALPTDMLDATKPDGAWSKLPTTAEEAYRREVMLNVYAMNDFIADTKTRPDGSKPYWNPDTDTDGAFGLEQFITDFQTLCKVSWQEDQSLHRVEEVDVDAIINNTEGLLDTYNKLKKKMYVYLGIPRVRFPWRNEDGTEIFLTNIYVDNTDLRYKGEQRPGEDTPATGEYYVILFSASTVAGTHGDSEAIKNSFNLADPCRLKSLFTVLPATTIKIDTDLDNPTTAICQGNLKKITATLNGYDIDGNDVDLKDNGIDYIFDWYLSSMEAYEANAIANNNVSIKNLLEAYRNSSQNYGPISIADLGDWSGDNTAKDRLIQLIQGGLLKTGTTGAKTFDLFINVPEIVAMPYVYENNGGDNYTFCTDKTSVLFDLSEEDIPDMPTGISGVTYPFTESAPLRLGQLHLGNATTLSIPVRKITGMSEDATYIGQNERNEVLLNNASTTLPTVGTVTNLYIKKPIDNEGTVANAKITIQWGETAKTLLQEGQSYELLIPFAQYNDDGLLTSACEGLASLTVKVVPEYLTWKGDADGAWYNDGNWKQSTEDELYMGNKATDKDANGNDDISNAFAPLYFTKITIPESASLSLEDVEKEETTNVLSLTDKANATEDIQYDMAVNTSTDDTVIVEPYYINKVSEIYFKPEATLMNQHYLDYGKAWVEFEIANSEKRWMASPLQNVYAGDIYAPSANGRQETAAFSDISYNTTNYSRWSPAFYQKAWNKTIEYATDRTGSSMTSVAAVKSNWSIEYNNVSVPYTPGKGFYLSVDVNGGRTALVRLPKADTEYTYEAKTKALRSGENLNKTNTGKLVALSNNTYTLNLKMAVDGDDKHFLVGNPFMTYLDMEKFFKANKDVLAPKYWTLANGAPNAVVGMPDINFEGESANGTVEPMQAFFVELKEEETLAESTSITFNADMMSANKVEPIEVATKSTSATHPVITLTAERGNEKSIARLLTSDRADNGYKADEDAVVLLDSELDAPMVYTVSGSRAVQMNAVKSVKNIGLGVFSESNDEVTVTIEGLSRMAEPLYLYDAQTRKSVKLDSDSYSLTLSGDSHGRYFLRDSALGSELENTISIYSARQGQVIVSALRPVKEIKVFGLNGSLARRFSVNTTQYTFNLPAGIYMIYASDGEQEHTEKIIVR